MKSRSILVVLEPSASNEVRLTKKSSKLCKQYVSKPQSLFQLCNKGKSLTYLSSLYTLLTSKKVFAALANIRGVFIGALRHMWQWKELMSRCLIEVKPRGTLRDGYCLWTLDLSFPWIHNILSNGWSENIKIMHINYEHT